MKYKCDYILLIMNCIKYRSKAIWQKNTWLTMLPNNIKYYHVIGDKRICENKKVDFFIDESERILYVNTADDYNSLPTKVINSFHAINERFNYKYIFKTDDDQSLILYDFFNTITKLLNDKTPIPCYGGFKVTVPTHISEYHTVHDCLPKNLVLEATTYCNGRFYLLHFTAVQYLITKKNEISNKVIEDHAIGYYLHDDFKKDMLHFDTKRVFYDAT